VAPAWAASLPASWQRGGCSVTACDWHADTVAQTAVMAREGAPPGVRVTSHACDVSDEAQVLRFREELLEAHARDHLNLVFANAGIGGGGGSFITDSRQEWERTFAVDWQGVRANPEAAYDHAELFSDTAPAPAAATPEW
jgi:NAD(P)-dependent dehydrogenase (short-subunit alcohol dehydrogenase family)